MRRSGRATELQLRTDVANRIIGEFWAMTTEGDGNYQLQEFLEAEGAECDIQLVAAWLLYTLQFNDLRSSLQLPPEAPLRALPALRSA